MNHIDKLNILKTYFGVSAIQITNQTKTQRERRSKTQRLHEDYNIIENDNYTRLNAIIGVLNKPCDKRIDKDL